MPTVVVTFGQYREYGRTFDGKQIGFPFEIIEQQYIGTPRQSSNTHRGSLIVKISGSVVAMWGLEESQLVKALFEVGKEWLQENLQNISEIKRDHEIWVTSRGQCPYDINHIQEPNGAVVKIDVNRQIGF